MTLKCPICGMDVKIGDRYMPFCSDRCKLIDLGNWASEKYKIESPAQPQDLEEDETDELGE